MIKRVYVLEYDITFPNGQEEHRKEFFPKEERDIFIKRYLESSESYYIKNLTTYFGDLEELTKERMKLLINTI